jgi:fido (protein-threonine AMPylation protein)
MAQSPQVEAAHRLFLERSRCLREATFQARRIPFPIRWLLERLAPAPLLAVSPEGSALLSALRWLEENCRQATLNELTIKQYHRTIFPAGSGRYREFAIAMPTDNPLRPAHPKEIPRLMLGLQAKLVGVQARFDASGRVEEAEVLAAAVAIHQRIAEIHPFQDGNGRIARLAMNHLLRRYGLGYVVLPSLESSSELWEAMLQADHGNLEALIACSKRHQLSGC